MFARPLTTSPQQTKTVIGELHDRLAALRVERLRAKQYFRLGQNKAGLWILQQNDGLAGGIFRTRHDAIHFARRESPTISLRSYSCPKASSSSFADHHPRPSPLSCLPPTEGRRP